MPDVSSLILQNLGTIAFCDFGEERKGKHLSPEANQVLKVMQFAMQYYMFAQKHLTNKVLTLNHYLLTQRAELEKLKQVKEQRNHKLRRQKDLSDRLNEQAIQYEVLIQKLRPDIREKTMKARTAQGARKDSRLLDANDERRVVHDVLKEQGLLKEGQGTVVYDKVAHRDQVDKENQAYNQQNQEVGHLEAIMGELKSMKEQIANIQAVRVQVAEPKPVEVERKPRSPRQRSSSSQQKYQSPARDNAKKRQAEAAPPSAKEPPLEESIRSEAAATQVIKQPVPEISANSGLVDSSNKVDDSASSSTDAPKMRRVRNPYPSSDLSGSAKTHVSVSQSLGKGKRRIEIEKVSDNEGHDGVAEDSYQDDPFEESYLSQKSNEKQRLQ